TTALDVTVQQQVLSVFEGLARAGRGVLLITHDLAVASEIADRIAVMQDGRIVETGPTRRVLTMPGQVYTRRLMAAVPGAATRGHWLAAGGEAPERKTVARDRRPLLEVDGVSVRFKRPDGDMLDALADVSLVIRPGETLGVVGESGSGKTTLGKVALALQ